MAAGGRHDDEVRDHLRQVLREERRNAAALARHVVQQRLSFLPEVLQEDLLALATLRPVDLDRQEAEEDREALPAPPLLGPMHQLFLPMLLPPEEGLRRWAAQEQPAPPVAAAPAAEAAEAAAPAAEAAGDDLDDGNRGNHGI
jgi:hypothetical protein